MAAYAFIGGGQSIGAILKKHDPKIAQNQASRICNKYVLSLYVTMNCTFFMNSADSFHEWAESLE